MDDRTAQQLIALNSAFYARVGESFAETRQAPWPGWQRSLRVCLQDAGFAARAAQGLAVADAACGNLRFHSFLREALAGECAAFPPPSHYAAFDNCELMLPDMPEGVRFRACDLLNDDLCEQAPEACGAFDLAVCFGFFHHIPGRARREAFLRQLAELVRPGGCVVISLWRFLENEQLAAKAQASTQRAFAFFAAQQACGVAGADAIVPDALEEGDCFLGWQDECDVFRYCHSFDGRDIDGLVAAAAAVGLRPADSFLADGRTGDLNAYLVFRAHAGAESSLAGI